MLALALIARLSVAGVSVHADVIRADLLVANLSRQSGIPLACGIGIGSEPLVIDFSDRPLEEVLPRIARVVGAEWVSREGTRTLTQSRTYRQSLEAEDRRKIEGTLASLLKLNLESVAALKRYDEEQARKLLEPKTQNLTSVQLQGLAFQSPTNRASIRLLSILGGAELAKIPIGDRRVYSDAPNAMQTELHSRCKGVLDDLRRGAALMTDVKERLAAPNGPVTRYGDLPTLGAGDIGAYRKTLLAVRRNGALSFSFEICCLDAKNRPILWGAGSLPDRMSKFATQLPPGGLPLDISQTVHSYAKLQSDYGVQVGMGGRVALPGGRQTSYSFSLSMAESQGAPEDRGLGELLSDPVANDPIGMVCGGLLRQVAARRNRALIACISDAALSEVARQIDADALKTDDQLLEVLRQSHIAESARLPYADVSDDGKCLEIRPYLAVQAKIQRFDRKGAKNVIARIAAENAALFSDAFSYLRARGSAATFSSPDLVQISHANPFVDRISVEGVLQSPCDFLAQLSQAEWQKLEGVGAPFGSLRESLRDLLAHWVYGGGRIMDSDPFQTGISDPTEQYPNGIPPVAPVRVETDSQPAVIARAADGRTFALSAISLAFHETILPSGSALGSEIRRRYVGYRPAVQSVVTITIDLPGAPISRSAVETRPQQGTRWMELEQLPSETLKALDEARKALRGQASRRPPEPKRTLSPLGLRVT